MWQSGIVSCVYDLTPMPIAPLQRDAAKKFVLAPATMKRCFGVTRHKSIVLLWP